MPDLPVNPAREFITRTVPFKYAGAELKFHLSQALFSQAGVDDGSALLLKTLAQQVSLPPGARVLDTGCGVGVLGLCLQKRSPDLQVIFQDRDFLAWEFTQMNAALNQLPPALGGPGLLLEDQAGPFDLIVSNLPAKAGAPVLEEFFRRAGELLTPQGLAAVVLVAPLAPWARALLTDRGVQILYCEETPQYTVFHFRGSWPGSDGDPYARSEVEIQRTGAPVTVPTVWGLSNFDSLDWETDLALDFLDRRAWRGPLLIWEPGQGLLARFIAAQQTRPLEFLLSGRDHLALNYTRRLLEAQGQKVTLRPAVSPQSLLETLEPRSLQGAVLSLTAEPQIPFAPGARRLLSEGLAPGAWALIHGRSTEVHRLLEDRRNFLLGEKKKLHGFMVHWLKRKE